MPKKPFRLREHPVLTAACIWVVVLAAAAWSEHLVQTPRVNAASTASVQEAPVPAAALAADDEALRMESLEASAARDRSITRTAINTTAQEYGEYTGTGRALNATRTGGNFRASAYNGYTGASQLPRYQAANSDVKAWLRIPGTNIDYPVVQSQIADHYYESLDVYKQPSRAGCLWMPTYIQFGTSANISSNTVIYGHNWNNCRLGEPRTYTDGMKMFEGLMSYHYRSWAEAYPYIYYSTAEEQMTFVIFACLYTTGSDWYIYAEPDMTALINTAQSYSLHRFDVDVRPGDKILTLSTCTRTHGYSDDQRFVVMARLLRPGEEIGPITVASK